MKKKFTDGVSLVELAIVLVIIGLLVTGALSGQEMVKQYKLQKVINQLEDINKSAGAFYLKYRALPGDFKKATVVFSNFSTVNGDGNGKIDSDTERLTFWQHLSFEGLVKGSFDPMPYINSGDMADYNTDKMFPQFEANSYYSPVYYSDGAYAGHNWIIFINGTVSADTLTYNGVLDNVQTYTIDKKVDDGLPLTGNIRNYSDADLYNFPCNQTGQNEYVIDQNLGKICALLSGMPF